MKKKVICFAVLLVILIYGCGQEDVLESEPGEEPSNLVYERTESAIKEISVEELSKHDNEEDCWIVYEGKVYDFTNARMHPNMAKTFYRHCGQVSGFEEGAKARHSGSSEDRVENFGDFVGVLK